MEEQISKIGKQHQKIRIFNRKVSIFDTGTRHKSNIMKTLKPAHTIKKEIRKSYKYFIHSDLQ